MPNTLYSRLKRRGGLSLVELLVSMVILAIVSTMIIMVWTNLQRSYASTVSSNHARETARDAMSRMRSEIREMEQIKNTAQETQCILKATADEIWFYVRDTRLPGDPWAGSMLLTRYWYDATGAGGGLRYTLYRQRDVNNNGGFDTGDPLIPVARNVVNVLVASTDPTSPSTPLFRYTYYDASGIQKTAPTVPSDGDLSRIALIKIQILVDLDPGRTPNYMNLESTVQPRNLRQT